MTECPPVTYYDIADDVTAFSTTRHGGYSRGAYASFNVNDYCGDDIRNIERNRALLSKELEISKDRFVMPRQTHGTVIRHIDESFMVLSDKEKEDFLYGVDGVMTSVSDLCIGVSTADCVPLLFYDPVHHAASAVHAGWRGTVGCIALKAVMAMTDTFGSDPRQLLAFVGPCISLECFEVGDEVYDEFRSVGFDMSRISVKNDKWHIDLPECNIIQMEQVGISRMNIFKCGICTYSNADDYFSARRLGIASGRIYTGIIIRRYNA